MSENLRLRPDGFRERGSEVTRLEAFVDASFAFALTMLVISVGIPDSVPKLLEALKGIPAFAASFLQIATFWYAHMAWSRRYGLDDDRSIVLSLLLVFLVLVYIYPLKVVYSSFFSWISGGWLPAGFELRSVGDVRVMFTIYGVVFATMAIVLMLLYQQAWRQRDLLELSLQERVGTIQHIARGGVAVLVATLSAIFAMLIPDHGHAWMMGVPGSTYALMSLSGTIPDWVGRRMRAKWQATENP